MSRPVAPLARLGQVMRLSPRGALPKTCLGCGDLFIVAAKGGNLPRFCVGCRARRCRACGARADQHYRRCRLLQARACRGCGAELERLQSARFWFCDACRVERCPECHRYAGLHGQRCRWEHRPRRPGLTVYVGVVPPSHILELYETYRPKALAIARTIVGVPENEDVVQDVFVYLLKNCEYLKAIPGPAYLFTAVRTTAIRRHLYAWSRYVTAMDFPALLDVEQMLARRELERRPEPVG